jgi:D-lyxose ketol-isomerase
MNKKEYLKATTDVKKALKDAGIAIPQKAEIEIADFGLNEYDKTGLGIYLKVNEPEYCSKWMVLKPKQTCPNHKHKNKKETFFVIKGVVDLTLGNKTIKLKPGDSYTLKKGTYHNFTSKTGAVIEEASTFDENSDSYFTDKRIIRDIVID